MNRFVRALASSHPLRHASAGLAITLFAVGACSLKAQAPRPRITAPVDDSVRVTLPGSVPALARAEYDLGEAPASTQLTAASLLLKRSPEQQAALLRALAEVQDPASPNYQHWLTSEEFGRLYGPANADIDAIVNWLEAEGLSGIKVPKGRTMVEFSGSVSLVEQVFHTSFHSFRRDGDEFIANVTNPSIPAALVPVVGGVINFNTIPLHSNLIAGPAGQVDPISHRLVRAPASPDRPEYTGSENGSPFLFITPGDAATMYNTPNKNLNANFAGGATYDGTGVTIGIIGNAPFSSTTDVPILKSWRGLFLPSSYKLNFTVTNVDGSATSTNALDEAFLDMEAAGGVAPGAALHFYTAHPITDAINQALSDNTVDILNMSFGECEKNAGTFNQVILNDWQQASMQGIAVTVSAGDSGSANCDTNGSQIALNGLAVNFIASTEYNVAVGGTDTWGLVNNFSEYVNPASSDAASDYYRTVTRPILESAWNNSQDSPDETPGPIGKAVLVRETTGAGGGGASSCSTQSASGACVSGYSKPSFQTGAGVPHDGVRDLPDLALMSGPGYDNAGWAVCSEDRGRCQSNSSGINFSAVGGTSAAAPAFAGILALVEQKTGKRLGQSAVSELYTLFNKYGSEVFNDITLGNNAPPCFATSANCVKNKAGFDFESGYNTTPGYDRATGLGSVNVTSLVEAWGGGTLPAKATVEVKPAKTSVFRGDPLSVEIVVSGSGGTPAGTVKLTGGGFFSEAKALAGGKATIVIPANALAAGSDTLTAAYSGSSRFDAASGSAKVAVVLLATEVGVKPASASVSRNKSLEVSVTVAAVGATPGGMVTLSGPGYTSAAIKLAAGKAHITIPAGKLTAGRDTLTVSYKGGADFKPSSGKAIVTVTKATTSVMIQPAVAPSRGSGLVTKGQ